MSDPYICHCTLTDFYHVVSDGRGCGMCPAEAKEVKVTPENVEKAFKWFRAEIEGKDDDEEEGENKG